MSSPHFFSTTFSSYTDIPLRVLSEKTNRLSLIIRDLRKITLLLLVNSFFSITIYMFILVSVDPRERFFLGYLENAFMNKKTQAL